MSEEDKMKGTYISIVLKILGVLNIIGGIIGMIVYLPGDAGIGYEWKLVAYTSSIAWLVAGIVSGILFFAIAIVLDNLQNIDNHLSIVENNIIFNKENISKDIGTREKTDSQNKISKVISKDEENILIKTVEELGFKIEIGQDKWSIYNKEKGSSIYAYRNEEFLKYLKDIIKNSNKNV